MRECSARVRKRILEERFGAVWLGKLEEAKAAYEKGQALDPENAGWRRM